MKKARFLVCLSVIFCLSLLCAGIAAADIPASGDCGECQQIYDDATGQWVDSFSAHYTFDEDTGTLTIYGTGSVDAWSIFQNSGDRELVEKLVVREGITSINGLSNCKYLESVHLPSTLQVIGNSAFHYCTALETLDLPSTLQTIGSYAFQYCTALETLDLPAGLTTISSGAFYGTGLAEIEIPAGISRIEEETFCDCQKLESVTFKGNITAFGKYAFSSCPKLKNLDVPASLTSVGEWAFDPGVIRVEAELGSDRAKMFSKANMYFHEPGKAIGYRYTFRGSKVSGLQLVKVDKNCKDFTVSDEVTEICDSAFSDQTNLKSIILPASVKTIGYNAFGNCQNLSSIQLPDGLETIGDRAFYYCQNLSSIQLPDGLETIGDSAFYYCQNLSSIQLPDGLETIGYSAFYYCQNLSSIQLPDGFETIESSAFYNCQNLKSIQLPDSLKAIGSYAFYNTGLISITIPNKIKTIEESTFYYCQNLSSIQLPDGLETIGGSAFSCCQNLKSIQLPDSLKAIGSWAFSSTGLTSIKIPNKIKTIEESTFYECYSLTAVQLPDNLETIKSSAFPWGLVSVFYSKADQSGLTGIDSNEGLKNAFWHYGEAMPAQAGVNDLYDFTYDITPTDDQWRFNITATASCKENPTQQRTESAEVWISYEKDSKTENRVKGTFSGAFNWRGFDQTEPIIWDTSCEMSYNKDMYQFKATGKASCQKYPDLSITETVEIWSIEFSKSGDQVTGTFSPYFSSQALSVMNYKPSVTWTTSFELTKKGKDEGEDTQFKATGTAVCEENSDFSVTETVEVWTIECTKSGNQVTGTFRPSFSFQALSAMDYRPTAVWTTSLELTNGKDEWGNTQFKATGTAACEQNPELTVTETVFVSPEFGEDSVTDNQATATVRPWFGFEGLRIMEFVETVTWKTSYEAAYTFDEYNNLSFTITATAESQDHPECYVTESVYANVEPVNNQPVSCESDGLYNVSSNWFNFQGFKPLTIENVSIPAYGHDYSVRDDQYVKNLPCYAWALDNTKAFAAIDCWKCHENNKKLTETVETTVETPSTGTKVYTAHFTNPIFETQTKTVESGGRDITPPQLTGVTINSKTTSKPGVVYLSFDFLEEESGLVSWGITPANMDGNASNLYAGQWYDIPLYTGSIEAEIMVDEKTIAGTYYINSIYLKDERDNEVWYNTDLVWGGSVNELVVRDNATWAVISRVTFDNNFEILDDEAADFQLGVNNPNLPQKVAELPDGGHGIVIFTNVNNKVPAEVFTALQGKNAKLTFSNNEVQWVFRGTDIVNPAKDIDLSIYSWTESGAAYGVNDDVLMIQFAENGLLPGKATIRIKSDYYFKINGLDKPAFLYFKDGEELLSQESDVQAVLDQSDKWCEFSIYHNSVYMVSPVKIEGAQEDTTGMEDVTEVNYKGGVYLLDNDKLTATLKGPEAKTVTSLTIPDTVDANKKTYKVTAIANNALKDAKKLKKVTIGNTVTTIGKNAFSGCIVLKTVKLGSGLTTIGDQAFNGCKKLTSITVPGKVTKLGKGIFSGCESLKTVKLGTKLTAIGDNAFKGCKRLTSITIPGKVKSIGKNAFNGCAALKSVKMGNSITSIGDGAFKDCKKLASIIIPAKVTKIGKEAFSGCKGLKKIEIKTAKLTKKGIGKNSFKGIYAKATFKCPKKQLANYTKWLMSPGGAPKTAKFTK